ncbi:uncharacterized protein TA13685 [Theileria annulata]|uniref:DEK-C domain-containing protein n=1 Tax=Theileria annulata TaxID=5874 RepID=Q4UEN4_THEAN|nr:uncharacterized protein TA13685 [Theileria annulata]CAI74455.1 hypothetical protein, conserved [Theileria annulata]|eukprot:XP_952187.1 hypothetical protein, conserved [Theileria annulata]
MQDHSFNNISKHDLHNAIRKIVRSDNLSDLTAGGVRKKLSEHFNTPKEYMDTRAQEVSSLINEVLREIAITSDQSHDHNANTDQTEDVLLRKMVDTDKFPDVHSKHSKTPLKVNTSVKYSSPTKHDNSTMKYEMKHDEKINYIELKSESPVKREYEENVQSDITTESLEPPRRVSKLQRDLMTKDFFLNNAKSIEIKLQESDPIFALPRLFSTGSCGWYCFQVFTIFQEFRRSRSLLPSWIQLHRYFSTQPYTFLKNFQSSEVKTGPTNFPHLLIIFIISIFHISHLYFNFCIFWSIF